MSPYVFVLIAYLIGSLSFAVIVSRAMGMDDPRSYGSGNPGATNVLRSGRKVAALLTLLGDTLKGVIAMLIVIAQHADDSLLAMTALAVTIGHMWPIFFRFQGGKGVATAAGVLFCIDWRLGMIVLTVWLLLAFVLKISSLAAIIAALVAPIACWFLLPGHQAIFGAVLAISALLIQRHKQNLLNLISGKEGKIGEKSNTSESENQSS
ncbi:glycerol-3-phosphate 1-O-acyltransferase PlsY [Burkholderiaceae bacterium DAT-1]|nr:glycerol-3-phosphate 1-O-acyltransferase PlsY [Burkholderiaceae bacterium DAT-1]